MQKLNRGLPYFLFTLFAIPLIFSRLPWIDESWFAGPAVMFMREGSFFNFAACHSGKILPHAYTFELYALLQAGWYSLGDFNLVWIRFLNVLLGLCFLLTVSRCLKIANISPQIRTITITLGAINYFFLDAATQNRPEIAAVLASVLSLLFYLSWRSNPKKYWYLSFASFLLIVAMLFHLQAAFTVVSIWVATFIIDRKLLHKKQIFAFFAPYVVFIVLIGVYLYPQWKAFIDFLNHTFVTSKMLGHSGGMLYTILNYWRKRELVKVFVSLVLIALPILGMIAFSKKNNNKIRLIVIIFAAGGYISWLGTTVHIDDCHAAWLSLALILSVVGAVEHLRNSNNLLVKIEMICIISVMLTFGAYAGFFVLNTVIKNPYRNIYNFDLDHFSSKYDLTQSTVGGVRDIQWYFRFSPQIFCTKPNNLPEYCILNNEVAGGENPGFLLLEKGRGFSIYKKNKTLRLKNNTEKND